MLFGLGACGDATSSTTPALIANSCGEITLNSASHPRDPNTARQAMDCFIQAYQDCSPTSLMVRQANTTLTRQFSIIPGSSACGIRQALQTDPNSPPAVGDCTGAQIQQNTLVIKSCSDLGDFSLTP